MTALDLEDIGPTKHAPRIITAATRAAQAADRWMNQYRHYVDQTGDKARVLKALLALGRKPKPDQVDAVIGNKSWTRIPDCDCCGAENLPLVVEMGQPADVESSTLVVCPACLADAAQLLLDTDLADTAKRLLHRKPFQ